MSRRRLPALCAAALLCGVVAVIKPPVLSDERLVLQTALGDIELAFFPEVAPVTVAHMLELGRLGGFTTNHFFRVDRGFVAQVADVVGGRSAPLSALQRAEAEKTVPGEFSDVPHTRGILSMGRYDNPDSATSSFSILLGDAPHLNHAYAVFGIMLSGEEVLEAMEAVETTRQGIFVMPKERISILSTYVYSASSRRALPDKAAPPSHGLAVCLARVKALQEDLHATRQARLPGQ